MDPHLISLLAPTSFEADQYRTLRHRLDALRKDSGVQVVAVTSPAVGDGKTITAINLAGTLAESQEARVLLVDADVRRAAVAKYLDLRDPAPGLVEALADPDCALEDVIRRHPASNLWVLPAGQCPPAAYEALKSARLGELLGQARRRYEHVVLDTPPLIPVPDARVIAGWVDGFLLVAAAHRTPRKLVEEALNIVDPPKMLGLVFNLDDRPLHAYYGYYGSYYHYGASHQGGWAGWWRRLLETLGRAPR